MTNIKLTKKDIDNDLDYRKMDFINAMAKYMQRMTETVKELGGRVESEEARYKLYSALKDCILAENLRLCEIRQEYEDAA